MMRALEPARLFTRAAPAVDELQRMVSGAGREVVGEVFAMRHEGVLGALAERSNASIGVGLLADPDWFFAAGSKRLRDTTQAANTSLFGLSPISRKNHVKAFVVDGDQAWLSTSTVQQHGDVFDITAVFDGDAARAVRELTRTGAVGSKREQRAAAAEAARHGVLLNDRYLGIEHLRRTVFDLVDTADDELVLVTKSFTDRKLAKRVVAAHRRGVDVRLTTQDEKMSKQVRKLLRKAGIQYHDDVYGQTHANAIVADGQRAYFGSGHFTERAMLRRSHPRDGRELGAYLEGEPHAARLRESILEVAESLPLR